MTAKRYYSCNLCGEDKEPAELYGCHWRQGMKREELVPTAPSQCEHHICFKCLADLRQFPDQPGCAE